MLLSCATPVYIKEFRAAVNFDEVEKLRDILATYKIPEREKKDALLVACEKGYIDIVKELLNASTPVNGYTVISPLHVAAYWGHIEIVKLLVENGADINDKRNSGIISVLNIIAFPEAAHIAHDLDKKGWNFLNEDFKPLHLAVLNNQVEVVKYLIQKGADVNVTSIPNHIYPLHLAAIVSAEICKILIEHGAKINVTDFNGDTPLDLAKRADNKEAIEILENYGAK
jgi:ankyrin repeat protein